MLCGVPWPKLQFALHKPDIIDGKVTNRVALLRWIRHIPDTSSIILTCQAESSLMRRHFWLRSLVLHRPMRQSLSRCTLVYKLNISGLLVWLASLQNLSNKSIFSPSWTEPLNQREERKGFPVCCHVTLCHFSDFKDEDSLEITWLFPETFSTVWRECLKFEFCQ